MSDNYVLNILLAEDNNYMGTGFSKKQWDTLKDLLERSYYQHRSPAPSSAPLAAPPQTSPPAQPAAAALPAYPPAAPPQRPPAPKTDLQATLAELSKGIRRISDQFDRLGIPQALLIAPPPALPPA